MCQQDGLTFLSKSIGDGSDPLIVMKTLKVFPLMSYPKYLLNTDKKKSPGYFFLCNFSSLPTFQTLFSNTWPGFIPCVKCATFSCTKSATSNLGVFEGLTRRVVKECRLWLPLPGSLFWTSASMPGTRQAFGDSHCMLTTEMFSDWILTGHTVWVFHCKSFPLPLWLDLKKGPSRHLCFLSVYWEKQGLFWKDASLTSIFKPRIVGKSPLKGQ